MSVTVMIIVSFFVDPGRVIVEASIRPTSMCCSQGMCFV